MSDPSVYDVTYTAVDFETTSLYPHSAEVVEIGAVKFDLLSERRETFSQLVKPLGKIPMEATEIHGITNEMVARSPNFEEALPSLEAFVGQSVILAHNSKFDLRFVSEGMKSLPVIDTLRMARNYLSSRRYKLSSLVESPVYHRALPDAISCMELFKRCIRVMEQQRGKTLIYLREITE